MNEKKISEIRKQICAFLSDQFNITAYYNSTLIGKNSIINSLTVMELIAWIEDEYSITNFLDDDLFLESLKSVDSLARKIERQIK